MSDVPSELYREILLRLPAESLFRFRSVCKEWLRIIDNSSFIKAHTKNQLYSHTLLVVDRLRPLIYSFSLDSLNFIKGPQTIDAKQLIHCGGLEQDLLCDVAYCNGLILTSQFKGMWRICNPLTGESRDLPHPNGINLALDCCFSFVIGFGYDCGADDYKVVRIDKLSITEEVVIYQTLVYSLKSDSWSTIEACPCIPWDSPGTFWNGALYWNTEGDTIIALDFSTESYFQLSLPPLNSEHRLSHGMYCLDKHLIYVVNYWAKNVYDVWVMKDNVWIKLYSLQYSPLDAPTGLKLVAYLERKQQVVLMCNQFFLWFDIANNNCVLKFSIHAFSYIDSSHICPGSLVRLNRARRTLTCERKMTKVTDTRLKFCVRDAGEKCRSDSCRDCKEV